MDVNRREICKSLIEWFNVLMADDEFLKPTQRTDLSDGVAMARALHKLSPDFFNGNRKMFLLIGMLKANFFWFRCMAVQD